MSIYKCEMIDNKSKVYYLYKSLILSLLLYWTDCSPLSVGSANEMALNELVDGLNIDPMYIFNKIMVIYDIIHTKKQNTEDIPLNATQLVTKYCCSMQEHEIATDDGYILTLFRIESEGPPVLLMHGLFNSADDWVTAGPDSGLAYVLAAAGFDVWMGNTRGNKYSRQHIHLLPEDREFWNFDWDEIANHDLPAIIDYILLTTNKSQLAYVGHSQGATCFFVLCSEQPEYNNKISIMIALSPIAWMAHISSAILKLAAPHILKNSWVLKMLNYHDLMPKPSTINSICNVGNGIICLTALFSVVGFDYEHVNKTNTQSILTHMFGGGSLNQVIHYLQLIDSRSFQKFDHGPEKNEEIYGCSFPPKYAVEKITVPVALFYSDNDWISSTEDILILKHRLQNVVEHYRVPFKKFNHVDYLYAKDVKRLVYDKVLALLISM